MVKRRRTNGFDGTNRPQNKPLRARKKIRPPRTTSLRVACAFDKNNLREPSTLSKYRAGYRLIFRVKSARKRMLDLGFKEPGTYRWNQQGGTMFAMPYDIPKAFDNEQAGWVCREAYGTAERPNFSKSQMEEVRACLSYAYQLQTGKTSSPYFKANYESVNDQYGTQTNYRLPSKSLRAKYSVEPEGLKTAYTQEWAPACGIPFPSWCVSGLISWDKNVIGCRAGKRGGLMRLQKSREHEFVPSQGILTTEFVGGRPKVPGFNKCRKWKAVRVCLCHGGKHIAPPEDWRDPLDGECNPTYPAPDTDDEKTPASSIPWCTTCPLNMFQCVQDLLPQDDKGRLYPRWLAAQRRFADRDLGHGALNPAAQEWLNAQGGNPDALTFCSNSGRKSCGKWCAELSIPYSWSFQLVGDLWSTWSKYYQTNLVHEPGFQERNQSTAFEDIGRALRKLARWFGRGRTTRADPVVFGTEKVGRLMALSLRVQGHGDLVNQILDGP